jgi:hypothetical protein
MDAFDALSDRQKMFVNAYIGECLGNATQAAIAAGYSERGAAVQGFRLLRNSAVRAAIDGILDACGATPAMILAQLSEIAGMPMPECMQMEGEYTDEQGETHPAIIRLDPNSKVNALKELAHIRGLRTAAPVNVTVETKTIIGIPAAEARGA